jgi:hypothetical protein
MPSLDFLNPINSIKLISMDYYLAEMIELYKLHRFPRVLLLNGKKGLGKFTLVVHFLNYIYTQGEEKSYNLKDMTININSIFYNQLLNQTNQDVLLIKAEENKNIKIEDIRALKSKLSKSTLSKNSRFTIIDEVEFMNENSANALLKTLEEPSANNFFILINNQQADLIKTISSRCINNNIFLKNEEINKIIDYLMGNFKIENLLNNKNSLTPGLFVRFNELYSRLNIDSNDNLFIRINKLLNVYKKDKDKLIIDLILFSVDQYFLDAIQKNSSQLDFLLNTKSSIVQNINDFINYNLNINSVLSSIKVKLRNV